MGVRTWSLLFVLLGSIQAGAIPLPTPEQEYESRLQWLSPLVTEEYDFSGIVRLSNCSGSIVRFETSEPGDRAMVLTNGHCIGRFPDPGEGIVGVEKRRSFDVLKANGRTLGEVESDLLMYATMTRTDFALYRLRSTYADIKSEFGIDALTLSSKVADIDTKIQVISGYWRIGYSCNIEKIIYELKEAEWTSEQSIRYSRPGCEVIGGTSGSPVLNMDRVVVGVNNTGNEDGLRCEINNPCEVDKDGNVDYEQGYSYGQQVNWIYSCLNDQREIDVNKQGCLLPH